MHHRHLALLLLALLLALPTAAQAHGGIPDGHKQTFTQVIGPVELAVTLELPQAAPGTLLIDILPLRNPNAATITLRAAARGQPFDGKPSAVVTTLPGTQGVYYTQLDIDQPGRWELEITTENPEGRGSARIPFTITNAPLPPFLIPLSASIGLMVVALVAGLIGGAIARQRHQPPARWLTQLTGGCVFAGAVAALIFGVLQWNDQEQRALASRPEAPASFGSPHANLSLTTVPDLPQANQPLTLTLDLSDGGTGLPVDDLISHHEALVHLVVLDESGAFVAHVHPPRVAPGRYVIPLTPDRPGRYTAYAEIAREASGTQVLAHNFVVSGAPVAASPPAPGFGTRVVEELEVEVRGSNPNLVAGKQVVFSFDFRNQGKPFTDLQPWLGMAGHMFARSADQSIFAHVHAAGPMAPTSPTVTGVRYGPTVQFVYTFPRPGRYQVWAQFRRDDRILTIPLTLEITP